MFRLFGAMVAALVCAARIADVAQAADSSALTPRSMSELTSLATIKLGKTADWVAITPDAVWVGSTGPDAVNRIDPKTNRLVASVRLPGEPCAGLAAGFGSLWIPLCTKTPSLAKIDLAANKLIAVFGIGAAAAEGGVAVGDGSVWLITDKSGTLVGVDPLSGTVHKTFHVPTGSYNPYFSNGKLWVSRAEGAQLTGIDAMTGKTLAIVATGPHPRFLGADADSAWTLNQGDGSLTGVDLHTMKTKVTWLNTPGRGGDISLDGGLVWTTMPKMPLSVVDAADGKLLCQWAGAGGDSLGLGHGAIWLTDYHGGSVSRISLIQVLHFCAPARFDR